MTNQSTDESAQSQAGIEWFAHLFYKYNLVASGWLGLALAFGWMFGVLGDAFAFTVLVYAAGMAGLYGHHGLAMGWFDRSQETGTNQEEQ